MKVRKLTNRLTEELRAFSRKDIILFIVLAAASLSSATASIALHVSIAKDSIADLVAQGVAPEEYHLNLIEALPFHLAFVTAAAFSWAGILFRNAAGFFLSLLSQAAMLTSYWGWESWSTRGGPPLISHHGPSGSNIFTTTMILPLSFLFICELVILGQVLWSSWRGVQSTGS